jgi:hypothetical protein
MAVILESATRRNAAPCMHFLVVLNADNGARTASVDITTDELNEPISDEDLRAVLKVWGKYQRAKGKTLAQMVGQSVIPDIP